MVQNQQAILNLSKTVAMKFWSKDTKFDITVDRLEIPVVTNTKFLGVHLDNELTWNLHLKQLIDKVQTNK